MKINVKLSLSQTHSQGATKAVEVIESFYFIFHIKKKGTEKKDNKYKVFEVISFFITIIYLSAERHSGPSGTVCQE